MKVLWSINTLSKRVSEKANNTVISRHSISWVDAMARELKSVESVELTMAVPGDKGVKTLERFVVDGIIYYVLPCDYKRHDYWREIIDQIQPDIIHAYGTEGRHNVMLIKNHANAIPIIISLQGILSEYVKYFYAGLSRWEIIRNATIGDIIHKTGIFIGKLSFYKRSYYEKYMLSHVPYVEGRSDWDYVYSQKINPSLKYFYCPRMIRQEFFGYKWKYESCERYSLFVHQGNYPIKGFHFMLEALNYIKNDYPNVKLYVSGSDIYTDKYFSSGYIRLIKRKIEKYHLRDLICFTGYLDADSLAQYLSRVHVCVIPSAIENAPNALAEAMLVGTPCIASFVGGNADMLNYGEAGLLYCYDEPEMLADRIRRYFKDADLCRAKAGMGLEVASIRHEPEKLVQRILDIYQCAVHDFSA